jgi:mono/diheme cytochrome c family protein
MKTLKTFLLIGAVVLTGSILVQQSASASFSTAFVDGQTTFKTKCISCHGVDGSGNTPIGRNLKLRPLGSAAVQAQSDAQLAKIISGGKGKMPAFGQSLNSGQINELVAHIRSLKQ